MAHELDFSNGQANIAYVNTDESSTPWHGNGQALEAGQSIEVWAKAAGLAHEVKRSIVQFDNGNEVALYGEREHAEVW